MLANQPTDESPAASAAFDSLLESIVRGTYAPETRLPAERELSRQLETSRPTLREALRKLEQWNLVQTRRGSGITVRPRRDWSIEVLPAYLRFASPEPGDSNLFELIDDLLTLRRGLLRALMLMAAPKLKNRPKDALDLARRNLDEAWAKRGSPEFVKLDLDVLRAVSDGAGLLPAVWMLNRITDVFIDIATPLAGLLGPPDDYYDSMTATLDRLAEFDADGAATTLLTYLERHDERLLGGFGGLK